jgi:hypothetical protein
VFHPAFRSSRLAVEITVRVCERKFDWTFSFSIACSDRRWRKRRGEIPLNKESKKNDLKCEKQLSLRDSLRMCCNSHPTRYVCLLPQRKRGE